MKTKKDEKRDKILTAAEEVLSQKELADSTISEIAQMAGVADSVIYQHFKGKEDLVFSIVGKRMGEILHLLDEHLQGIGDAESLLRKMIWFHLWYNDKHPAYSKILLHECLSNKAFYSHPAHEKVYNYAKILLDILIKGSQDGSFCRDLDLILVRDIILGTLGCEIVSCFGSGEIKASLPDFEAIMELIHAMIAFQPEPTLDKSERVLIAAEKVFAEKGFSKAKVLDIAKLAEVAEGTVYEYFENKEDLLFSISERRLKDLSDKLSDLFQIKDTAKKLRRFIKYFFTSFFKNRDFLKVFVLEIQLSYPFIRSKAFEDFRKFFEVIEGIIEEGKAAGSFRSDVNSRVFRNMFIGTFNNLTLRWFILKPKGDLDKTQKIEEITDLLCAAVTLID